MHHQASDLSSVFATHSIRSKIVSVPKVPLDPPSLGEQILASAEWSQLPYHAVLAELPDGSTCYLPADKILLRTAERMAIGDIRPAAIIFSQLLPATLECPACLIQCARRLQWAEAREMAKNANWITSVEFTGPALWELVSFSLSNFDVASPRQLH